ncbi:MAG: RIP metalloprotease RseP [Candidatus Omnitrophica bacterium]|nr:RIP metalloprotease RseP [Candidatus Omnitrophota bacterium]
MLFIAILSVLVMVHEFGHFIAARKAGVRVETFSLGFGPKLASYKGKQTEYMVCAVPLGGYVKLAGDNLDEYKGKADEYLSKPVSRRFWIIFAGPALNYLLGILFFWVIFAAGYPSLTAKVGGLLDGMGAQQAGIQIGDKIIAVEGTKVTLWEELQKSIQAQKSQESIEVTVLRQDKEYKFQVKIQNNELSDILGQKRSVGLIGIKPKMDESIKVRYGLFRSLPKAVEKTGELTVLTYKAFWLMLTQKISMKDSVTGPLGMFFVTSEVAKLGVVAVMNFMALLSISLGIFNLLPLPALDGGHLVLLGLEKARGRYLSKRSENIFNQVGFSFIILLAALVFVNDLVKFGFIDKAAKFFIR